jgi:NADH:ubiquinone oxidoreductase subunit 2 (subunit N)
MYIGDREADARPLSLSAPLQTALVVCAVAVILIGVYPHPFIKAAESVVTNVLPAAAPLALR